VLLHLGYQQQHHFILSGKLAAQLQYSVAAFLLILTLCIQEVHSIVPDTSLYISLAFLLGGVVLLRCLAAMVFHCRYRCQRTRRPARLTGKAKKKFQARAKASAAKLVTNADENEATERL